LSTSKETQDAINEALNEIDNVVDFTLLTPTAKQPTYGTEGSAGLDLYADADAEILGGARKLIPLGFAMALPASFEAHIRSRSGLATRHGIDVPTGTIDPDYRGSISVLLHNTSAEPFQVKRGDRIAQMVITKFERVKLRQKLSLDVTGRGIGGFGSTGR
jgi:dUTP pyrophosphatase